MKFLILVLMVAAVVHHWDDINRWIDPAASEQARVPAQDVDLVMYSTQQCGYCDRARNLLQRKGIPFDERDINRSRQAKREFDAVGGRGVPTFVFDGEEVQRGWNEDRLLRRLGYR